MTMPETQRVGHRFKAEPVAFPGAIESAIDSDVAIRISAKTGYTIETPSGPSRVLLEEGEVYKPDSALCKGVIVRIGGLTCRIVEVGNRTITIGCWHFFGSETFISGAAAEKASTEKTMKKKTGE